MREPNLIDGRDNPLASAVLDDSAVVTLVSGDDEMLLEAMERVGWDRAIATYFETGLKAAESHRQIVAQCFARPLEELSLLDFAAGYGRATRYLVALHGHQKVTASDLQSGALDFQRQHLGVTTLPSCSRPADFDAPRKYDVVNAHSFFSHLPKETFGPWLSKLFSCVSDDGILVFSVHDQALAELYSSVAPETGIAFARQSEADRIDKAEYGSSWVSEDFVRAEIAKIALDLETFRWPRGLANYQDLYVVSRRRLDLSLESLDSGPLGHVGIARRFGNALDLIGWVSHFSHHHSADSVWVQLGEARLQTAEFFERPDVAEHLGDARHLASGFHFRLADAFRSAFTPLIVRAKSTSGISSVVYAGTAAEILLDACRAELETFEEQTVLFEEGTEDPLAERYVVA